MSIVDAGFLLSLVGFLLDLIPADHASFANLLVGQDDPSCDPCQENCGSDASCDEYGLLSGGDFTFGDFLTFSLVMAVVHFFFPILYPMEAILFGTLFALLQAAIVVLVVTWPFLLMFAFLYLIDYLFGDLIDAFEQY